MPLPGHVALMPTRTVLESGRRCPATLSMAMRPCKRRPAQVRASRQSHPCGSSLERRDASGDEAEDDESDTE